MTTRTKHKGASETSPTPQLPTEITTAQVHVPLLDKIRVIRQRRGETIPEVFDRVAGPAIDAEYKRVVREMAAEVAAE